MVCTAGQQREKRSEASLLTAPCKLAEGKLQCICSVLRSKHGGVPAACEVLAITLSPPVTKEQPLHVDDIQLLQVSFNCRVMTHNAICTHMRASASQVGCLQCPIPW
jgi:hypothetical protein